MNNLNQRNTKLVEDKFYKHLSEEVQLLFMMTNVFMYEGAGNLKNIIEFCDMVQEKDNDICVLIAKVFCYEYIIEQMVNSLYTQDILWKRVKYKDINYREEEIKRYDKKVKNIEKIADFNKAQEFSKNANHFRKIRNLFAHSLGKYSMNYLFEKYKNLDMIYRELYEIYSEQNIIFLNRISLKLENPTKFLSVEKDYQDDISIIKKEAFKIKGQKTISEEDKVNLANFHQIYWFLKKWNNKEKYFKFFLYFKEELVLGGLYAYIPVESWEF